MFRFNNPDALLVLLLVGAAYAMTRALEDGRDPLAACCAGVARRVRLPDQDAAGVPRRARRSRSSTCSPAADAAAAPDRASCSCAGAAMVVSAGWWVAIVELVAGVGRGRTSAARRTTAPRADRSATTASAGSPATRPAASAAAASGPGGSGARPAGAGCSTTSWAARSRGCSGGAAPARRPAVAGPARAAHRPRAGPRCCSGAAGWSSPASLQLRQGIIHPYYTVALAPAIGALVGIGAWCSGSVAARCGLGSSPRSWCSARRGGASR